MLIAIFCCSPVFSSDFGDIFTPPTEEIISEDETATNSEQVASGEIYLDSSVIDNPFTNIPSPSEYKKLPKTTPKIIESPPKYTPIDKKQDTSLNEFVPPNYISPSQFKSKKQADVENNNPVVSPTLPAKVQEVKTAETSTDSLNKLSSFSQSIAEDDIDYEGKIITGIRFTGLKLIKESTLRSVINSHNGSVYNSERLQEDLQRIYNIGYFTDIMSVEPLLKNDDTVELNFIVNENIPVNDISIVGNTVLSTKELLPFITPLKGLPQNLKLINSSIEKINKYYQEKGYILANVVSVDDTSQGNLSFGIAEGVIDKIVWDGNEKTKDFVIARNVMTEPGAVYNEEYIKKDLARLYSTQIFDEVDRKIEPSPDKEGEYVITIEVKEGTSNSVSIGGGVDNALGIFGSVGYQERNFLGRGQKLSLSGMIGSGVLLSDASIKNRMNYNLELNFKEPHFINADNSLSSKLYYRDLGSYQVPLAIERRWGVNGVIEHKVKGYDNLTTNLGLGFEHIKLKEGDYNKISELYRKRNIDFAQRKTQLRGGPFLNIAPGIKYSTVDDETMPRKGMVAKASFMEAFSLSNLKRTNGRLIGAITKYIPVFKKSTLAIGAKGGIKVHGDEMPEVMAFRLGGPYPVRGFKMNGVGTGESFLMASAELQTPIPFFDRFKYDILKNTRFAFFVDAGKVFDPTVTSKLFDRPNSAITAGVGLRVYIPGVGPITVDYGIPLTNPGHYGSKRGYFTFGTGGLYDSY
ncbi:BamA/TamA family outer membrane protein [bacterium]|nr:BamA/TamA family outer membrane protein [bacterium]